MAKNGLFEKYSINYGIQINENHIKQKIIERFEYELSLIIGEGVCEYYLLISDYVRWARSQKIITTVLRSTACSFIAYLIGISNINPLKYELPFERLSPLDGFKQLGLVVCSTFDGQEKITNYLKQKYSEKKIFDILVKQENICKSRIHHDAKFIINEKFGNFTPSETQIRHGVILLSKEQFYNLGMQKLSIVHLEALDIISKIESEIRLTNKNFCIDNVSLNDKATYDLFVQGDTSDIFQFEKVGLKEISKRLKVNSINEIAALIALYRPGSEQFIERYIENKFNALKRNMIYILLDDILAETYGILVYQEQFMMALNLLGGYSLRESDIIRRDIYNYKTDFIEKAKKTNGIEKNKASNIFHMLETYCRFAFNKSHAISCAMISYKMAYLKVHYLKEFKKIMN